VASIALDRLEKRYPRGPTVVRSVSLEIPDGAFVTLVGPSGSGKTTTLNLIAGLDEPSGGVIRFDGAPVNDLSPRERDVAMVFQSYALYPHKTVFENLAFPLRIAGETRSEVERRVRDAARRLEIEPLLDRRPRELSGGQRQRVALGRAIVRRPRVFLLDEPLSNLDAGLRVQMRAEIKRLHQDLGVTFVYVTHDQAEAMTLSDRVVVFHDGAVQQYAPPREVYDRPANVFVARFLGSPPISLFLDPVRGVLIGVRAEDARVATEPRPDSRKGRIFVVEPMGPETFVTVELEAGGRVVCRAEPSFAAPPGAPAWVTLDPARLHLFDPRTERRIAA
jgi:multiple sugar transport system ATP-binding protein